MPIDQRDAGYRPALVKETSPADEWLRRVEAQAADMRTTLRAELVEGPSPAKRSSALALTKLDECVLWAREFVRELNA